ncbi:hypothetical protein EON63_04870 [archaeon]|nr:MAG: hypothetical protein EON63_04870 [archaeon]
MKLLLLHQLVLETSSQLRGLVMDIFKSAIQQSAQHTYTYTATSDLHANDVISMPTCTDMNWKQYVYDAHTHTNGSDHNIHILKPTTPYTPNTSNTISMLHRIQLPHHPYTDMRCVWSSVSMELIVYGLLQEVCMLTYEQVRMCMVHA